MLSWRASIDSWWVLAFAIVCFGLYEQGARKLEREITTLNREREELTRKIQAAQVENERLTLDVASMQDPAWIERELIKNLGLIPTGSTKIFLKPPGKKSVQETGKFEQSEEPAVQ